MREITDSILSAPSGVATTVSVSTINLLGVDLPLIINIGTVVYLGLLIVHKGYKMYRHWKHGEKNESEE